MRFLLKSYLFFILFLASCSDSLIEQYPKTSYPVHLERFSSSPYESQLHTQPSFKTQKDIPPKKQYRDIALNSSAPIDYQKQAVGNIHINNSRLEVNQKLNLLGIDENQTSYKEGLTISWDSKQKIQKIQVFNQYKGSINLGPKIGEKHLGDSFSDQFRIDKSPLEDEKAKNFLISLYRYLENTDTNCLEEKLCFLNMVNPQIIKFELPKMEMFFTADKRRVFISASLTRVKDFEDRFGFCAVRSFDFVTTDFFCKNSKEILTLGKTYSFLNETIKSLKEIEVTNYLNFFIMNRLDVSDLFLFWSKKPIEKPEISEEDFLNRIFITSQSSHQKTFFLLKNAFIKVRGNPSDKEQSISLSLETETKEECILDKNCFYLSSSMPEIRENFPAQKKLLKALLDLISKNYKITFPNKDIRFHKRVYGRYGQKNKRELKALLVIDSFVKDLPLVFNFSINEFTGHLVFSARLVSNDFVKYILRNQKDQDLNQGGLNVLGFSIGDRIYLHSDDIEKEKFIRVGYFPEERKVLKSYLNYSEEKELKNFYQTVGQKDVFEYQKFDALSFPTIFDQSWTLYVRPLGQGKEIDDEYYYTYEIKSFSITSDTHFFKTIKSLCGLNLELGMSHKDFIKKIESAKSSCSYISPQNINSSRRTYFFSKYGLEINFLENELSDVRFYELPEKEIRKGDKQ